MMYPNSIEDIRRILLSINIKETARLIKEFIRDYFERAGAEKAIIGVSGGVDSSATLMLTRCALGKDAILALIMPHEGITPEEDVQDALEIVKLANVEYKMINIDRISMNIKSIIENTGISLNRMAYGNIIARSRMIVLYAFANTLRGIVVGTGDKSEIILGYYTKYGDGGVDILPIGDVYKSQVRILAKHVGVPEKIAMKPSSPRLWAGQTAAEELGADYIEIDPILFALFELGMKINDILSLKGIRKELVYALLKRIKVNEHKRMFARIPKIHKGPTIGIDWKFTIWR